MKEWLSINELATKTGIPDTTIRRYIAKLSDFFVSKGGSRSRRYDSSAIEVLSQIKDLYDKGLETDQVANELGKTFPMVVKTEEPPKLPAIATELTEIRSAIVELKLSNDELLETLRTRDELIRELLETNKNQLLEFSQQQVNQSWWQKLFKPKE